MDHEFKLVIETDRLSATDLATILRALDRSFKAFVNRRGGRSLKAYLVIGAVRYGSVEIILDAVSGFGKLMQAREYLGPFATHIAQLAGMALSGSIDQVGSTATDLDRKAVKSLVAPVANGNAHQVSIVGNNNIILNIPSASSANAILERLEVSRTLRLNNEETDLPALEATRVTSRQLSLLEQGELVGTVFSVNGEWYARLVEGQGVLVPIRASETVLAELQDGGIYSFRGQPARGNKGETVGITVHQVIPIGTPPQTNAPTSV